jgi:hypothetical protein
MKKIILMFFIAFALDACGGKETTDAQTLTETEENQLVEEASDDLNTRVNDISTQADSLNNAVDSLLKTVK